MTEDEKIEKQMALAESLVRLATNRPPDGVPNTWGSANFSAGILANPQAHIDALIAVGILPEGIEAVKVCEHRYGETGGSAWRSFPEAMNPVTSLDWVASFTVLPYSATGAPTTVPWRCLLCGEERTSEAPVPS